MPMTVPWPSGIAGISVDSLRWIAKPLSSFKKTLGLGTTMIKGYFPHWFNTAANADYTGVVASSKYFRPQIMKDEHLREIEMAENY